LVAHLEQIWFFAYWNWSTMRLLRSLLALCCLPVAVSFVPGTAFPLWAASKTGTALAVSNVDRCSRWHLRRSDHGPPPVALFDFSRNGTEAPLVWSSLRNLLERRFRRFLQMSQRCSAQVLNDLVQRPQYFGVWSHSPHVSLFNSDRRWWKLMSRNVL